MLSGNYSHRSETSSGGSSEEETRSSSPVSSGSPDPVLTALKYEESSVGFEWNHLPGKQRSRRCAADKFLLLPHESDITCLNLDNSGDVCVALARSVTRMIEDYMKSQKERLANIKNVAERTEQVKTERDLECLLRAGQNYLQQADSSRKEAQIRLAQAELSAQTISRNDQPSSIESVSSLHGNLDPSGRTSLWSSRESFSSGDMRRSSFNSSVNGSADPVYMSKGPARIQAILDTAVSDALEGMQVISGLEFERLNNKRLRNGIASSHHANPKFRCGMCNKNTTPQWRYVLNQRFCNACYMRIKRCFLSKGHELPPSRKTQGLENEIPMMQRLREVQVELRGSLS